ncbi:thioredoxin domain-containing protein [uncultured Nocardioides sp.]|uniref:DsbA family protein n=1 Tax=uncultured Nocardioides sp. TaxID=198441 RepID=UPI0025EE006B|nr:thioredoxin domain-containing protein [uncultured Nocardioides sp.]
MPGHFDAERAARAVEAAAQQGARPRHGPVEADYDDPATLDRITKDVEDGQALGVQGTPTFFVNGEQLQPRSSEPTHGRMGSRHANVLVRHPDQPHPRATSAHHCATAPSHSRWRATTPSSHRRLPGRRRSHHAQVLGLLEHAGRLNLPSELQPPAALPDTAASGAGGEGGEPVRPGLGAPAATAGSDW